MDAINAILLHVFKNVFRGWAVQFYGAYDFVISPNCKLLLLELERGTRKPYQM